MSDQRTLKLLLIEDDTFIRELYLRQFQKAGIAMDAVASGQEGIDLAQKNTYDGILLDVMMPDITGIDVLKTLKQSDKTKHIPVIFLTNLGQEDIVQQGFQLGAIGYLIKSAYTPDQIIKEVEKLLIQEAPLKNI